MGTPAAHDSPQGSFVLNIMKRYCVGSWRLSRDPSLKPVYFTIFTSTIFCHVKFNFQLVVLTSYLETKKELPGCNVTLQFWPEWIGQLGLPCVVLDDNKEGKKEAW